jgi:hypothetical protein
MPLPSERRRHQEVYVEVAMDGLVAKGSVCEVSGVVGAMELAHPSHPSDGVGMTEIPCLCQELRHLGVRRNQFHQDDMPRVQVHPLRAREFLASLNKHALGFFRLGIDSIFAVVHVRQDGVAPEGRESLP